MQTQPHQRPQAASASIHTATAAAAAPAHSWLPLARNVVAGAIALLASPYVGSDIYWGYWFGSLVMALLAGALVAGALALFMTRSQAPKWQRNFIAAMWVIVGLYLVGSWEPAKWLEKLAHGEAPVQHVVEPLAAAASSEGPLSVDALINQSPEAAAAAIVKAYPYLDTPEGAHAMRLIIAERDERMARGESMSAAIVRAAMEIAPKYAPFTFPEARRD